MAFYLYRQSLLLQYISVDFWGHNLSGLNMHDLNGHMLETVHVISTMASLEDSPEVESSPVDTNDGSIPVFADGQLSFIGHDVKVAPLGLMKQFVDSTVRLDLSFNRIRSLEGLDQFSCLQELVLDNNELDDHTVFPFIPSLTTLCLNKNRIEELEPLLTQLKRCYPQLSYLSLLGNAACPNQLSSCDKDDEDYQRYRYYVLFHLPGLRFLDSSVVHGSELQEARCRGKFMQVVRPQHDPLEEASDDVTQQYTPLPSESQRFDDSKPLGFYSKSRYSYHGRHSEGNRFIRNKDL